MKVLVLIFCRYMIVIVRIRHQLACAATHGLLHVHTHVTTTGDFVIKGAPARQLESVSRIDFFGL
jgi:hypothetical protein